MEKRWKLKYFDARSGRTGEHSYPSARQHCQGPLAEEIKAIRGTHYARPNSSSP
jgi:hypothetical protein